MAGERIDYTGAAVEAARSVLIELTHFLGEYRNNIILEPMVGIEPTTYGLCIHLWHFTTTAQTDMTTALPLNKPAFTVVLCI
jgi:hypothetical protein